MLNRKGFAGQWIEWTILKLDFIKAYDLNGERGEYFRSYKGLRQGDPLSPLLFNLVADALDAILSAAKTNGVIRGLIPELVEVDYLTYSTRMTRFYYLSTRNKTSP